MARIRNALNDMHKKALVNELYIKFGLKVSHSHQCEKLSDDIKHTTKKDIGANTVRRFLGFLKTEFAPSLQTLDILAEYCGYDNWAIFTEQADRSTYEPLSLHTEAAFYLNFYKIDMREEGDMNYHNACRNIALRILFNNALLDVLAAELAKNHIAQIYFYERFPFIDGLGGRYKKYLTFYLHNKMTDESKIFGNALLFLSAFLCENVKDLHKYYLNLQRVQITDKMHPFIIARFIGSNILYSYKKNGDTKEWIKEAYRWNSFFLHKKNISFWHFPYYQYMICDYLNLAEEFEDSHAIINTISQHKKEDFEIEEGYKEGLQIIFNMSRHVAFKHNFIKWVADKNAFSSCNTLFKKYLELQSLCLYQKHLPQCKKKNDTIIVIRRLVADTGFVHFNNYLDL